MSTGIPASNAILPFRRPIALQHADGVNVETISAGKTLTRASAQVQKLNGGASNRDVTLPAPLLPDGIGHVVWVYNSGATNNLVVKTSAAVTLATLLPAQGCMVMQGTADYVLAEKSGAGAGGSDFGAPGLLTDVVAESTAAAGVTIDGLRVKDAALAPVAGGSAFIDVSACATGEADVVIGDNLADALTIRQAANAYLTIASTNDAERVTLGKILAMPVTTVAMGDAAHALVLGTAGAGQTKLLGNLVVCDPESGGASEELTLPAEASSTGVLLMIVNSGGEGIVVKDDGGGTVITLDTAQHGIVFCDGTTWRGFMGAIT